MNKLTRIVNVYEPLFAALLVLALLTGCAGAGPSGLSPVVKVPPPIMDGQVYSIGWQTALHGVRLALSDALGTGIYFRDGAFLVKWTSGNYPDVTYWVGFNTKQTLCDIFRNGGNVANRVTFQELESFLKNDGWKIITGEEAIALGANAIFATVGKLVTPGVILIPVNADGSLKMPVTDQLRGVIQ